ncbi:hypothetical protein GP486_000835 [Trichoglossum hirsutum]|uniref:CMP/dCMP-type deaminase domain-containing protein n=1 Tax=Trichoglossum hirsutum TaxID=265104 RepID=A0A9P8LH24_9PEZI|nr:hypothetical protein GP486_000835 [Trichoglossum hirsutum]
MEERMDDKKGLAIALEEARAGSAAGGIPFVCPSQIATARIRRDTVALVSSLAIALTQSQAEIAALENAGRQPAHVYRDATMYTTLSPCDMCSGACLLFGVKRVVMGENSTFVGGEELLRQRGVEVVNLGSRECEALMQAFVKEHPEIW